jgi:hypothetical protein
MLIVPQPGKAHALQVHELLGHGAASRFRRDHPEAAGGNGFQQRNGHGVIDAPRVQHLFEQKLGIG